MFPNGRWQPWGAITHWRDLPFGRAVTSCVSAHPAVFVIGNCINSKIVAQDIEQLVEGAPQPDQRPEDSQVVACCCCCCCCGVLMHSCPPDLGLAALLLPSMLAPVRLPIPGWLVLTCGTASAMHTVGRSWCQASLNQGFSGATSTPRTRPDPATSFLPCSGSRTSTSSSDAVVLGPCWPHASEVCEVHRSDRSINAGARAALSCEPEAGGWGRQEGE